MKNTGFPTSYSDILRAVEAIDPVRYGKTRNYVDGAVTYLSPYISRGVISTRQVLESVLKRGYRIQQIESFVKELCWRDYFQRVGQHRNLQLEIRQAQVPVANHEMPVAVSEAATGIEGIDTAIRGLYETGYMHNHCRMYTASVVCNLARSHWLEPARWMYYHLLDGDWASNACSWQWVAGANSSKKYYADQDNVNKYTHTGQRGTFMDADYGEFPGMEIPGALLEVKPFRAETRLPEPTVSNLDPELPTFIYNYYNLDPLWHRDEQGNRILLLEPEFFRQYPVSDKCIDFILQLAENIPGIQVYVESFVSLVETFGLKEIFHKEHPLNTGYTGTVESRDWIAPGVQGYFPSFFAYWKKVEKQLPG
jgi:deoxyribodipyrimidine photo-lyase